MKKRYFSTTIVVNVLFFNILSATKAEVVLDGSLGKQGSLAGPHYAIEANMGKQAGQNLFHSFSTFNIDTGESATFSGADSISNIISRITGGESSRIDGQLISTIPDANLYLLNSAGFMFGKNASLNIQGSFHFSTADYLRLGENEIFHTQPLEKEILSVASPTAFGFLDNDNGTIIMDNMKAIAPPGNKSIISVIGGNIEARNTKIGASSGRLNFASVAGKGEVSSFLQGNLSLSGQGGSISAQNSTLDVMGDASGNVYIRAGRFTVDNVFLSSATGTQQGGNIDISADEVNITNNTQITTTSISNGNSGNIILKAGNLNVENGSILQTTTFGTGQGGTVNIQATDTITLSGIGNARQGSKIVSNAKGQTDNAGNGGVIELRAKNLYLSDGAMLASLTDGQGQGGKILLKVSDIITFSGEDARGETSGILTTSSSVGKGGLVQLETGRLLLENGAKIGADTLNARGGDVIIRATGDVTLSGESSLGTGSFISSNTQGSGNGGKITMQSKELHLLNGAQLAAATFGSGQGGEILINADKVIISGFDSNEFPSGIFSSADNTGDAGTILLTANTLKMDNWAEINAGTYGAGVGGNVGIQANRIILTDNAFISALSEGEGDAGHVALKVGDTLFLLNSAIETATQGADGGNIILDSNSYALLINSDITTSVQSADGNGGNILMKPEFIVMDNAKIIARAISGDGGNINIFTTGIYRFSSDAQNPIDASSKFGVDGIVSVHSPDANVDESLVAMPAQFMNAAQWLKNLCAAEGNNQNSFVLLEREGVPNAQDDWLSSDVVNVKDLAVTPVKLSHSVSKDFYNISAKLLACKGKL